MTPAGLGGCVIEMMDRGLVDFVISTGANLYHDLHYALNFTLHRGSPFLNDVELYEEGVIRIYDVLFPATVLLETDAYIRDFIVRSGLNEPIATSEFHYRLGRDLLERYPGLRGAFGRRARRAGRRAALHLVARRQLDRHEHRLSRADERQPLHDRSEQGRQRGLRDRARRQAERLRHPRRRLAEELLPAGAADACGRSTAFRRAATTTSSRSRPTQVVWGGLSGATPAEAVSWGKVNPGVLPDTVVAYCDSTIAFPLFCEYASARRTAAARARSWCTSATRLVAELTARSEGGARQAGSEVRAEV